MADDGLPRIHQVLLLRDPDTLEAVGAALWAMLEEVDKIYNLRHRLAEFSRTCVAADLPEKLAKRIADDSVVRPEANVWEELWAECEGAFADTIDQRQLVEQVDELLERANRPLGAAAVIVTDQELTPPPESRYILWDSRGPSSVVSLAAMDPSYWSIHDPQRPRTLKHRARAACMCTTGEALGFSRCQNEQCYLFSKVDSVLRLDLMRTIGREHTEYPSEETVGYLIEAGDPGAEQEVVSADDLQLPGWQTL